MPFDERFFPDFLDALLPEAPLLVEVEVETFLADDRLPLAPARFLVEATLVVLPAVFLVLFLAPREVTAFFEADRPLLDFRAADPLRAFVVGIFSSRKRRPLTRLESCSGKHLLAWPRRPSGSRAPDADVYTISRQRMR